MRALVRDVLAFARVEAREVSRERVVCGEALAQALDDLAGAIAEAGAVVTSGELPAIPGERSQLVQLLLNLVGNAIKYHGPQPPRVHIDAVRAGGDWVFSVADNGIGVDAVYHERIFEVFQRLHHPEEYPGTGIGLALCRKIVQQHGGRIWVESSPGEGSRFKFAMPACD
jgi:light-regulated signal transduction histidine kinase (bacteriophytochrome)